MELSDINPFLRYAKLQPSSVNFTAPRATYDYRLFYIISSQGDFITEEQTVKLTPGDILYIRPGRFYNFSDETTLISINFDMTRAHAKNKHPLAPDSPAFFDPDRIYENDPPAELSEVLIIHNGFDFEQLFHKCISHMDFPNPYSDAYTSSIIKEILSSILMERSKLINSYNELMEKIMIFLHTNYHKDLKNEDISKRFGYHPFYLNRIFKENTGITLHQMLLRVRLQNAKDLLRQTTLTIDEIHKETGFNNRTQFCTFFRKQTGLSPSEYRKQSSGSNV